jgi:ADP-ribosylglycohydrolase
MHDALSAADMLADELTQRRETNYDVDEIAMRAAALDPDTDAAQQWALVDELDKTQQGGWNYVEPSTREEIIAVLPADTGSAEVDESTLRDKILGAWQGRIAGCNLGKPVEFGDHWTRAHLKNYLEQVDAYPLLDYIPKSDDEIDGYVFRDNWVHTTRGRVHGSARDDDIDYAILGTHILDKYGRGYTSDDVAFEWLGLLPFLQTYTAERVAMRNLIHGLKPPDTARYRNPYREWIGAQIRADAFGWVNPGAPRAAALLAIADATLSHVANGIYGEMWSAALVAAAFTAADAREAVTVSLEHIPPQSRLAEAIRDVLSWHSAGLGWSDALDNIDKSYGHYHWVHTINNAAAVAAGLLWADGDFSAAVGLTVQAGMDTDSNGATAGSVAGVLAGARNIPRHWVDPLEDRVTTAVFGYDNVTISSLAERTVRLASVDNGRSVRSGT